LAREAGAKNMHLFHFSPKYRGKEDFLVKEAEEAFAG
jgi:ribonuclease BN (tRNA processing enzyme)